MTPGDDTCSDQGASGSCHCARPWASGKESVAHPRALRGYSTVSWLSDPVRSGRMKLVQEAADRESSLASSETAGGELELVGRPEVDARVQVVVSPSRRRMRRQP